MKCRAVKAKAGKARYIGCYRDNAHRDLPRYMGWQRALSSSRCNSLCGKAGYLYAGLQDRGQCFCGNKYGHWGKANNCNEQCTGDKKEKCGGGWANSVWRTSHPAKAAASKVVKRAIAKVTLAKKVLARARAVAKKATTATVRAVSRKVKAIVRIKKPAPRPHHVGASFKYLGCFRDHAKRDLPAYQGSFSTNDHAFCTHRCAIKGFKFAGMQVGGQCFCGNSHGRYGKANNCTFQCPGDRKGKHKCGGGWANTIWGIVTPKPAHIKKRTTKKAAVSHVKVVKLAGKIKAAVLRAEKAARGDC